METITIEANGLAFTARVAGPPDGDVVIFLHGFPDDAATFDQQLAGLAEAGFRAIAPTLRGYEPSSQPSDGDYSLMTLAGDVVAWLDRLGVDRAHLVGHDWGAVIAYVVAAHHGDRCRRVVAMAVPPLARIPAAVRRVPRQLGLSWYMTFFQLRGIAERSLRARDWALLRWLWRRWSPGLEAPDHVIDAFAQPGVVPAALGYYRQNATPPLLLGLRSTPAMEPRPIDVPILIMNGERDGCMAPALFDRAIVAEDFGAAHRHEVLTEAGHFLHLDRPAEVTELVRDWLT